MDITWLGHAAVRVRGAGAALIADPYPPEAGLRIPPAQARAEVVTLSSNDPLHAATSDIEGVRIVLDGPGEYEASGMHIRGVRTARLTPEGEPQRWNTMYTAEIDGLTFCHLGNPAGLLSKRELDELGSPHIVAVPAGSVTGLSAADAAEIVQALSPKVILPVLYAHSGNRARLRELRSFLSELGARPTEPQPRLSVTRASLPEETQIVALSAAGTLL